MLIIEELMTTKINYVILNIIIVCSMFTTTKKGGMKVIWMLITTW